MLKSHEDVLKDLLRVKKLSQRVSSVESKIKYQQIWFVLVPL
jgi:hypothetical protein